MSARERGGAAVDGGEPTGDAGARSLATRPPRSNAPSRSAASPGKATMTQRFAAGTRATARGATEGMDVGVAAGGRVSEGLDDPFGFHLIGATGDGANVQTIAARGVEGAGGALPHREQIQASFGRHEVSGVRAHVGGAAAEAAGQIGAAAYATGNDVAFSEAPDLHTAAHEAAHVVQQRQGVQLYGGVGTAGDLYEQHADAVADRVVRGESVEALLDSMPAGGGAQGASVQRRSKGRGRERQGEDGSPGAAGIAPTEIGTAAQAVIDAAGLVSLVSATRRFDDGAVKGLESALETLGGVLFHDAHPRRDDASAVKAALTAARSAADALDGLGPRERHAIALRKIIGTIERQANASAGQPAATPAATADTIARTLERLERARETAARFPRVDLAELGAAIAQTAVWRESLAGVDAASSTRRLAVVVGFQHDLVRSADKDLAKVVRDPAIADHGHVVAAFVHAMASATDPANGRAVLAWARSERDRQVLRTAEAMLDGAGDDVATLGGAKIDAHRGQRGLEQRIDQLDARLISGGAVDDLVLRETLVAAREHAFATAMQALEVQTLQLADACAAANDGLIAKTANLGHATIKRLPKELRDLAKVPHTFRIEFRKQAARAARAQVSDGAADSRAERLAVLAARTAVLDNIEPQARAWAAEGYLQERLHAAEAELRDAQVRAMIVMVAATVVQVAVGNFAGAAAGRLAQAAMVGRSAAATEFVVGAATMAGDLAVNTAFQKAVVGDDASILTIAGLNVANAAVMKVISRGFASLGAIESASMRNATLWQRLGPRVGQVTIGGLEVTSEMIAGAAVDYASRKVAGEHASAPGDMTAEEWLLQGAAMGVGRFVAGRTQRIADRSFRTFRDRALAERATALGDRAEALGDRGSVEAANAMLVEYRALVEMESAQLEAMLAEHTSRGGHVSDDLIEDLRANTRAGDHLEAVEGRMAEKAAATSTTDAAALGRTGATSTTTQPKEPVILHGTDAEIAAYAANVKPLPSTIDVFVHGEVDWFIRPLPSDPINRVNHRVLAAYILKAGVPLERVRLIACTSGKHPKGVAQHLANKLHVPVIAPTDKVHISPTGELTVGPRPGADTGTWITYTPQPSELRYVAAMDPPPKPIHERLDDYRRRRAGTTQSEPQPAETTTPTESGSSKTLGPAEQRAGAVHPEHTVSVAGADNRDAHRQEAAARLAGIRVTDVSEPGALRRTLQITAADGQTIAAAVGPLGGQVIEWKAGLLLRLDGHEWYFQYGDEIAAAAATRDVTGADRPATGLPDPNVSTVELHGMRGVRRIDGRKDDAWTNAERVEVATLTADQPLLEFGHVGVSFAGDAAIYALTPKPPPDMPVAEVKRRLKAGEIFPGQVLNDKLVFDEGARRAAQQGWNTAPLRAIILLNPADGPKMHAQIAGQVGMEPGATEIGNYGFPPKDGARPSRDTNNCATYPRRLGLPIPEETGNLRDYIPELERWAKADAPIDARTEEPAP